MKRATLSANQTTDSKKSHPHLLWLNRTDIAIKQVVFFRMVLFPLMPIPNNTSTLKSSSHHLRRNPSNRKSIYFVVSPDYNNAASSWIYDAKWQFNLKTSIIYERLFLTPTEKLFSTCEPGLTMTTLSSFHLIFALRIKLFSEAKIQGGPWKSHF